MRDIYKRKEKLQHWINRINEDLEGPDKEDVLKFVEYMQDNEKSILWIIRCITALISMRKQLSKSYRDITKDDIRSLLKWMEENVYKASTHEKFRKIIILFF